MRSSHQLLALLLLTACGNQEADSRGGSLLAGAASPGGASAGGTGGAPSTSGSGGIGGDMPGGGHAGGGGAGGDMLGGGMGGLSGAGGLGAIGGASGTGGDAGIGGQGGSGPGPSGSPCASGLDCWTGLCVDGVCCNGVCDGFCMACAEALTGSPDGTCASVNAGTDPDDECLDAPCDSTDTCNGAAMNPTCEPSPCWNTACYPSGTDCFPFCATDAHCPAGFQCEDEQCLPLLALGDVCSTDGACDSGFCNGVCCAVDCGDGCDACALDGLACMPSGAACSAARPCNGAGGCRGALIDTNLLQISWEVGVDAGPRHVEHYELYAMPAGDTVVPATNQNTYFPTEYSFFGGLYAGGQAIHGVSGARYPNGAGTIVFGSFGSSGLVDFNGTTLPFNPGDLVVATRLSPTQVWSHHYGDGLSGGLAVEIADAEYDKDGNLFLAGAIRRTVDFGSGPVSKSGLDVDVLILKLDPAGDILWVQRLGDDAVGADQAALDLDVDSAGRAVVLGTFAGSFDPGGGLMMASGNDAFMLRLLPDGAFDWQLYLPGGASGFDLDGSDNITITGFGPTDFGTGPVGPNYLAKLDPSGNPLWTQTFDFPVKADVDFDGNIALMSIGSASLAANASFGAGPILPAGTTLQGQPSNATCAGIGLVGVAAFDSDGNHRWSRGIAFTGGTQYVGLVLESYDVAAARHGGLDVSFGAAGNFYVDTAPPSCPSIGFPTVRYWRSSHFSFAP